jgi:hypothetical protein
MNTCTIKGEFALFLRNLGKTLLPTTTDAGTGSTPATPVADKNNGNDSATRVEKTIYRVVKMKVPDLLLLAKEP